MTKAEILALQPGRELDALVAQLMEPVPPAITARDLRAEVRMTEYYSVNYADSRGGWWKAQIGTDHNLDESGAYCSERDSEPVTWIPSLEPSTDIAAAWQVVEAMRPEHGFWIDGDDGYAVEFQHGMPGMADYRHGRASAPTAPEAICKAALLAKLEGGAV